METVPKRLTDLLWSRVLASDGRCIGHVFDLRCKTGGRETQAPAGEDLIEDPQHCEVRELIYGKRGWLATIGLTRPSTHTLPWSAVQRVGEGEVVMKEGAV